MDRFKTENMTHEYFAQSRDFFEGLNQAMNYGLQAEYVAEFLKTLNVTRRQVQEAVSNALLEWDL